MNPIKVLKDSLPALTQVLTSIHAHLEQILEENRMQTKLLIKLNESKIQSSDKHDGNDSIPTSKHTDNDNSS